MSDERRRSPRLSSSARVLWHVVGENAIQFDRLKDVSDTGCLIMTETVPSATADIHLELLDEEGERIAECTGRVVWFDPDRGIGIEFTDLKLDAEEISKKSIPPKLPPPIPGVVGGPPPLRPAYLRVNSSMVDELAPVIEPLAVPNSAVIGIDLGTTNTCASYVVDGKPQILHGRTGTATIPSMISLDEHGEILVGQRALDRQVLHPGRTVYGSKRLLGRTFRQDVADAYQAHFAFPLAEAKGQRFGVRLDEGRVVSMDEVATAILKEVRLSSEEQLGFPIDAAVITVPAYFSEVQRDAVRRAAQSAGLSAHRLVSEPTAAAVAYGHKREVDKMIAVWDFGGGTFDFTVVQVRAGSFEVVATGGDGYLGGTDFDDALAAYFLEAAKTEFGEDFEPNRQQVARVREAAELAKRALSAQTEFVTDLPSFHDGRSLRPEITRTTFERITRKLVGRSVEVAQDVLLQRGLQPGDVEDVVLVGGTTRIPAVQESVQELFGKRPSRRINPDEAVALGAAILAAELSNDDAPTLLDVLPMSVCTARAGGRKRTLVNRNTRVPLDHESAVETDVLGTATLPLFQGDHSDLRENEYLCTAVAEDTRLRQGERIVFRLHFDEHCMMSVDARNEKTGKAIPTRLDRSRSVEEILTELGAPEIENLDAWQLPTTGLGTVLTKLFGVFRRKKK